MVGADQAARAPGRVSAPGASARRACVHEKGAGAFTEETWTVEVNRTGARIALKHAVAPNDTIRIADLENLREADFRVLDPVRLEQGELGEWGVECLEPDHNLWDIKFSPPLQGPGVMRQEPCWSAETVGRRAFAISRTGSLTS